MTGSGTIGDPYIIENVDDLQAIEDDLDAYYELSGNIDASATSDWNGNAGFAPITTFAGQLDGKGFIVDSLFINRTGASDFVGLCYDNYGTIQNLGLTNCDITGEDAGSITCNNYGAITNCYATGSVASNVANPNGAGHYAGGLLAYNDGDGVIQKSYSECAVGGYVPSGFCSIAYGTITDCYSRGAITGTFAGGFVVFNYAVIDNCYSTGLVTATYLGGFCWDNGGTVSDSFWDTQTSETETSDGGTGKTTAQMKTQATFVDAGWDFPAIWAIDGTTNNGYPFLSGGTVYPTNPLLRASGIRRTFWAGLGGLSVYQVELALGGMTTAYVSPIGSRDIQGAVPDLLLRPLPITETGIPGVTMPFTSTMPTAPQMAEYAGMGQAEYDRIIQQGRIAEALREFGPITGPADLARFRARYPGLGI